MGATRALRASLVGAGIACVVACGGSPDPDPAAEGAPASTSTEAPPPCTESLIETLTPVSTVDDLVAQADRVVVGTISSMGDRAGRRVARVRVTETITGRATEQVEVFLATGGAGVHGIVPQEGDGVIFALTPADDTEPELLSPEAYFLLDADGALAAVQVAWRRDCGLTETTPLFADAERLGAEGLLEALRSAVAG